MSSVRKAVTTGPTDSAALVESGALRSAAIVTRFPVEALWPEGGTRLGLSREVTGRPYDVAWYYGAEGTGVAPANPKAGWGRGELVRAGQPAFVGTHPVPMYDPTDPSQWNPGNY